MMRVESEGARDIRTFKDGLVHLAAHVAMELVPRELTLVSESLESDCPGLEVQRLCWTSSKPRCDSVINK
jgi:hypothetical protein